MRSDARYLRGGWNDHRPSKFRRVLGFLAFVGVAAAGYAAGDWVSTQNAEMKSREIIGKARQQLAAAVCVDDFMRQPDAEGQLMRLVQVNARERSERIVRGGWATMPDRQMPDAAVAALCAARLGEVYTSVRRATPISAPRD